MNKIILILTLLFTSLFSQEYINFGKFQNDNTLFVEKDIKKLSEKFLGVKYVSNTLSNHEINTSKENLIINFESLDCFTFIDTIQALKQSTNKEDFVNHLINIRYKSGDISYKNRNHFYSDWIDSNSMTDITCTLGNCHKKVKYLNENEKYLKEIDTVQREISYINFEDVNLDLLQDGDYVGIYTDKEALDVTHTGIIVKKFDTFFIRHASSLKKEIIDSNLALYTKNKLGIIVYRDIN